MRRFAPHIAPAFVSRREQINLLAPLLKFLTKFVPRAGIEPALYLYNWILSPARLPVPPPRQ